MLSQRIKQWGKNTLEQGRLEGREEGREEGKEETLRRLLERRFGPLPPAAIQRVESASLAELEGWFDRLLDARTLQEVFAADSSIDPPPEA